MNGQKKSFWDFGLGVILILVLLAAFFAWVSIPNFVNPKRGPAWDANRCINNLRQMDAAANQFALEQSKTNGQAIRFPDDLTPYIKLTSAGNIPPCPGGGVYHLSKVGDPPTCTLSTATPAHVLP